MKIKALLISSLMVLSVSAFAQDLGTQVSDLQQQNRHGEVGDNLAEGLFVIIFHDELLSL